MEPMYVVKGGFEIEGLAQKIDSVQSFQMFMDL